MLTVLAAVLAMAAKDAVCTFLTVAEARGRALLAGVLAAIGDLANVACTVVGAGTVIVAGLCPHTFIVLAAMMATSLVGTTIWTKLARRIGSHNDRKSVAPGGTGNTPDSESGDSRFEP